MAGAGVDALAASAVRGAAVLAAVHAEPDARARRALAAVRARVARQVPCRCVWLWDGRVYPE